MQYQNRQNPDGESQGPAKSPGGCRVYGLASGGVSGHRLVLSGTVRQHYKTKHLLGADCLCPVPAALQLTGGAGVSNRNNGIWAQDTFTFDKATSLTTIFSSRGGVSNATVNRKTAPLSFKGLFGCAEAYKQCTPDSPANCLDVSSECPVGDAPSSLFEGECRGSNNGKEAGWTFNVGGPASAMTMPDLHCTSR
jgi:hypothetical protein